MPISGSGLHGGISDISSALGNAARQQIAREQAFQDLIRKKQIEQQFEQQKAKRMQDFIANLNAAATGGIPQPGQPGLQQPRQQPRQPSTGPTITPQPSMSLIGGGVGNLLGEPIVKQPTQPPVQPQSRQQGGGLEFGKGPFLFNPATGGPMRNPLFESEADKLKRKRLEGREARINDERDLRALGQFGGVVNQEQIDRFSKSLGFDLTAGLGGDVGSGRVSRMTTKDGGVGYKVLSDNEYSRLISEGKFTAEEQKHIRGMQEERSAWIRVENRLAEIGVSQDQLGEVVFEGTDNPFLRKLGIASIPARFQLARQFADDPRYQAVARDIDIAFQKFRTRVTGAQASDKEIERLRGVMAALTDQPGVFFATISNFKENIESDYNDLLDLKESFGRDVSQFRELIPSGATQGVTQPSAPTLVNKSTGERMILENGQWVPLGQGTNKNVVPRL